MRKLLSFLVIALLFIGSMPFGTALPKQAKATTENKKATMIALKLYPAHSTRDGKVIGCDTTSFAYGGSGTCTDYRSFPWERKGTNNWGRYAPGDPANSFLMPNVTKARDMGGTPIAVTAPGAMATYPKFWGEFYLDVNPDGTKSQEQIKWYVVLDSAGQVWFDPDGQFNDPRYQGTADPQSMTYTPGSVTSNVMARIDPIKSNNTQGPYIINQNSADYKDRVYVWDRNTEWKLGTDRTFRFGWVDLPEYAREGGIDYQGNVSTGIVKANEFEISTSVNWAWDPFNGKSVAPVATTFTVKQFPSGYTLVNPVGPVLRAVAGRTYYNDANGNGRYDSDEYIYKKGNRLPLALPPAPQTPNLELFVQPGDYRLTMTSVAVGGEVFSYAPSESNYIDTGDKDVNLKLRPFMYNPADPYFPNASNYEIRYYDQNNTNQYNLGELIYRVYGDYTKVKGGDVRLTNIFVTGKYVSDSTAFSTERVFAENDVLILNEVLRASCANEKYDISVESNVWMGNSPSVTAATLRTPNKEFPTTSQRIQKNTVLDPTGNLFEVPASTFHDIQPFYREYLGLQIFRDNGIDNNRGVNLIGDSLIAQSLNDEFKAKRLGEEFLGATGGSMNVPDFGRILTPFPDYVLYYDANPPAINPPNGAINNRLGCGEALYEKKDKVVPSAANKIVQAGDKRLTPVTFDSNNEITYPAGSIVQPGDADVSKILRDTWSTDTTVTPNVKRYYFKYYDAPIFNKLDTETTGLYYTYSKQYEPGEDIYFDTNDNTMVDIGDIRLTEVDLSGVHFNCGSTLEFAAEYWFNQSYPQMIPMGRNGDPRFMDIEVVPGKLDLKVDIDKPLKVEQTSTVKLSLASGLNLKKGEKVFITVREPKMSVRTDTPPKPLFQETLVDPGTYTGITPNMTQMASMSTGGYAYMGNNFTTSTYYYNLWGSGGTGFMINGVTYDNILVTEDGMVALFRGQPIYNGDPSYPYEYIYDYKDYPGIGYIQYSGRPYPYSAVNQFGGYDGTPHGYLYVYPSSYYYATCYMPWDQIMLRGTWIIPFGGQWHMPTASQNSYPGYYTPLPDYGVYWEKTNEYVRIVWKVCTQPFTASYWDNGYYGPNVSFQLARSTSEFEMVMYRAGLIAFNYSSKANGKAGMNVFNDNIFLRNNDADRGPINAPDLSVPDPDPGNRVTNDGLGCGFQSVRYKPIIGVSSWEAQKYQLSKYSYGGASPIPNFSWLEGKTILFGSPENPDVDLYNQRLFTAFGVIDQDHPYYEFQYTPYRGSCNDGFHGINGFMAGTSIFNQLEIKAYVDRGGVLEPVPMDSDFTGSFSSNYKDPFWIRSKFNKREYQENYRKEPIVVYAPEPINTVPNDIDNFYNKGYGDLRNTYDCFFFQKFDIAPEELVVVPDKKCLDLASSKTPNISYRIYDKDNPNDVNDPANLPFMFPKWFAGYGQYPDSNGKYDYGTSLGLGNFSQNQTAGGGVGPKPASLPPNVPGLSELSPLSKEGKNVPKPGQQPKGPGDTIRPQALSGDPVGSYGRPLIMNFNAHGGGVDYLFTAQRGDGAKYARYIVQVNTDGSYEFWRWFEYDLPGQVFGALDQHDVLYTNRGTYITQGGQWDTVSGGNTSYMVPDSWRMPAQFLEDMDGSYNQGSCKMLDDMFPPFGDVTVLDRYGMFGSSGLRNNPPGDTGYGYSGYYFPYPYPSALLIPSSIITFGVPVVIMSPEDDFGGGIGLGVANPRSSDTPLTIRIYSNRAIFDYNSAISHPEYFTFDPGEGIDYLGYTQLRILPLDPVMNFADMNIADRAMMRSRTNYTKGLGALSPLDPPTPQIKSWYDPILYDWSYFTAYPGGQTHTGRAKPLDLSIRFKGEGRNSTPAIYDMYKKLGTEFFPLSDYGIFFSIRDAEKNHYTFDPQIQSNLLLSRVTIKGPFMRPKMYSPPDSKIDTAYRYKGINNVPIQYDTTGLIDIDATSMANFEINGRGFNRVVNLQSSMPLSIPVYSKNKYARYTHSLYYGGTGSYPTSVTAPNADNDPGAFVEGDMPKDSQTPSSQYYYYYNYYYAGWYFYSPTATYGTVPYVPNAFNNFASKIFALDEIIPTGPGKITIEVETASGIKKVYQDCCQDNITDGITVDGLDIKVDSPKEFTVDQDNSLDLTIKEYNKKKDPDATDTCNDALLVVWQDRGAIDPSTGAIMGAGDGWVTNPPRSSDYTNLGTSFLPSDDLNGNGKVSYNDYETEIVGSYDLATNTWSSGIIDARTFHRGNGQYRMELSQNNGSRLETVGIDFGGINLRQTNAITFPDGVIGDDETLPVVINAYKFGDDNNDRGFTPLYNISGEYPQYSHEVYLAGRVEIPILSQNTYDVTVNPSPLTAGIQPELQDPTEPLTFNVNDETGAPVDLLKDAHKMVIGVKDEDVDEIALRKAIWNNLFKDPHPEPLPQYYWTRTDLHNDDGSLIGNTTLYSSDAGRFEPIKFDITQSSKGKYLFTGFVANDAGNTDIIVYSADRRKMGKANLKVELPNVSYQVSNYDDPDKTAFAVPGDPDFTMTAGDNMIYKIGVSVKDAQGRAVKGLGRTVSVCSGGAQEVARFTPFATAHKNYYRPLEPWYWHFYGTGKPAWTKSQVYNGSFYRPMDMIVNMADRWDVNMAIDLNQNGKLEINNNEIERTRPMRNATFYTTIYGYYGTLSTVGYAYYNTENSMYNNGTFSNNIAFDINHKLNGKMGWGLGCIYNRPYYTPGNYGLIFANFDKMGDDTVTGKQVNIGNTDSLNLNVDGETEFYVFGEDVCEIGGLVGKSSWSISPFGDVAGSPTMFSESSPRHMWTRYGRQIILPAAYRGRNAYTTTKDLAYRLDWDGMPSSVVKLRAPQIEPFVAETLVPLGKNMMDENNYDLVYGQENHVYFQFYPADKRDIPLKDQIKMILAGNQDEFRIAGRINVDPNKPSDPASTTMFVTPTGTGLTTISLDLSVPNTRKEMMRLPLSYGSNGSYIQFVPDIYNITDLAKFDVVRGLQVTAISLGGPLSVNTKTNLKVLVAELGTKKPIEGATVTITGSGIKSTKTTDKDGICYVDVTPNAKEAIVVEAKKDGYMVGRAVIDIGATSDRKDMIQMDPIPQMTNQTQYVLKGQVSDDVLNLTINQTKVTLKEDKTFQYTLTLKEGINSILMEVEDKEHRLARKIVSIELRTKGPQVIVDQKSQKGPWVDMTEIEISGKVDPGSIVLVNQLEATVASNTWSIKIPVVAGKNLISILAKDQLGNTTMESLEIYVSTTRKVEIFIGSKEAFVDGKSVAIEEPSFISEGRTYIPLKLISDAFGSELKWNPETRGITITKNGTTIDMIVGSTKALVNDKMVEMDAPPMIRSGRTFIPVRFVSEILGAKVTWNARIKLIFIEILV